MKHYVFFSVFSLFVLGATAQNIVSITATRHEITSALDANPDRQAQSILAPFSPAVDSTMSPVLGICNGGMDVYRPESPLSDWVSDVLRQACRRHFGKRADVAIYNMGGIRSVMPAGQVTQGHIFEIAPFENYLCLLTLRGENLIELCHNIASTGGEGISGLRITATKSGRLVSATVNGKPIKPAKRYTVATLNYLAEGNDKMLALKNAVKRQDTTIPVRDILMDAIRRNGIVTGTTDGRMTVIADGTAPHQPPLLAPASSLRILHTNDTHSQILPYNPHSTNRAMANKGGAVRRSTFLQAERARTPDLLLFDAGDFSQGSLYYNLYKGEVEVRLMNHMRYNACTIGNHEFDFGLDNMARIFRLMDFPVVNCNYDFTGTALEGLVKPYIILNRGGKRIGVLGVGCPLDGMVAQHNRQGVTYTDPRQAIQPIVDILRNQEHCDLVICLSHLGWDIPGINDQILIAATRGIDIVIGGHSHTYMEHPQYVPDADGRLVLCYQMGKAARFVGDINVQF